LTLDVEKVYKVGDLWVARETDRLAPRFFAKRSNATLMPLLMKYPDSLGIMSINQ
jgi:hypothetical protein